MSPLLLLLFACSGKDEEIPTSTDLTLTVWSVEEALTGYVDNEFVDGFDVTIEHWITTFSDVSVGDQGTGETLYMVDWAQLEEPYELGTFQLGSGTHAVGLKTVNAVAGTEDLTEIDEDIRAQMIDRRLTHWIQGYAEGYSEVFTFAWGLQNPAYHENCADGSLEEEAETPGIAITEEEVEEQTSKSAEINFHLDHIFYDAMDTEVADMRFEVFYEWRDVNTNEVPWDDLAECISAGLTDRRDKAIEDENGHQLSYSNAGLPLTEYLMYNVESMVHLNGQGICEHDNL